MSFCNVARLSLWAEKTQFMRNIKTKKRQENVRLVLAMVVALLLPIGASAQGLFQRGAANEERLIGDTEKTTGMLGNRSVETTGVINNQTFGQAPLGSGALVLLAAGVGYAVLRRKEEKQ